MLEPPKPDLKPDRDQFRDWYLNEDVIVTLANGDKLTIPKGYRFDGHSIPFPLNFLFSRALTDDIFAALVHDFLIDVEMFLRYDRRFQDNEYRRFMEMPLYFTNNVRRFVMPRAVRAWGWFWYDLWGDNRGEPLPNTQIIVQVYPQRGDQTERV